MGDIDDHIRAAAFAHVGRLMETRDRITSQDLAPGSFCRANGGIQWLRIIIECLGSNIDFPRPYRALARTRRVSPRDSTA